MSKLLELREKRDELAKEIKRFAEKANDSAQDWTAFTVLPDAAVPKLDRMNTPP